MGKKITYKVISWLFISAVIVGPFLPWTYSSSAADAVYEWLFSVVLEPFLEWWIWFLAPIAAGAMGARSILSYGKIKPSILVPTGIFLFAWAALFLTDIRAYTGFRDLGFAITFIGILGLASLAVYGLVRSKYAGNN